MTTLRTTVLIVFLHAQRAAIVVSIILGGGRIAVVPRQLPKPVERVAEHVRKVSSRSAREQHLVVVCKERRVRLHISRAHLLQDSHGVRQPARMLQTARHHRFAQHFRRRLDAVKHVQRLLQHQRACVAINQRAPHRVGRHDRAAVHIIDHAFGAPNRAAVRGRHVRRTRAQHKRVRRAGHRELWPLMRIHQHVVQHSCGGFRVPTCAQHLEHREVRALVRPQPMPLRRHAQQTQRAVCDCLLFFARLRALCERLEQPKQTQKGVALKPHSTRVHVKQRVGWILTS
mmetsp:Transcript_7600/g.16172  ORF Transcript_7600/g.16172 Transcript_7600/m.16172 type:complete len:286 (+) Transcript_7600:718-1575(+)